LHCAYSPLIGLPFIQEVVMLSPFHVPRSLAAAVLLGLGAAGTTRAEAQRPFDPLTPAERQEAIRLATGDGRVRQLAGNRGFDVALVELLPAKPADTGQPVDPMRLRMGPRQAEVLISVYDGEFTGIRAVVDLQRRAVAQVAAVERGGALLAAGGSQAVASVPFSPREVEIARSAVAANAGVRSFAATPTSFTLEYLPISTPDPEFCPSGRCLEVLFRRGDSYLTSTAVVDIPSRAVRVRRGPQ
jgi:hypothetical protein